LLVVIAIIGVLIAILLPAVNAARESGRRSACANNMRQLGLGVSNFISTHGGFPASSKDAVGKSSTSCNWIVALFPYIEQQERWDYCWNNGSFRAAQASPQIKTFLCPSDQRSNAQTLSANTHRSNYAAVLGKTAAYWYNYTESVWIYGDTIAIEGRIKPLMVSDGMSKTLLLAEVGLATGNTGSPPNQFTARGQPSPLTRTNCYAGSYVSSSWSTWNPGLDTFGGQLFAYVGTCWPARGQWCTYLSGGQQHAAASSSFHNKGVNVVMCDGSTKFVNNDDDSFFGGAAADALVYSTNNNFGIWGAMGTKAAKD
jgi:prepilin-type processing-associated H-X9-DG protein